MRTQLLSHNKIAYQKVMKAFETSDRTCVVHPTGTGKSYLIAAVSESYKKVLILGPNIFVLDQVHNVLNWRKEGVEYMTYILLMMKEEMPTGYDLICLDEFHRAGAPEWGVAVDRLFEANPRAKVLGTTATPIRFLDDNRDMADELFRGNIASFMTLKDAWDRNILATPRFVTGLFEFDKVAEDAIERINKSRLINKEEKRQRLTRINNLRLDWEHSRGMPSIIRKHIDKDARRIIVFCGNVEKLKDMERTIRMWFDKAGIKVASVYMMHAYMTDNELSRAMADFETDTDEGVKLMLSVNMLNEGVHIPRVNAVILLRTTSSKIIFLQQIGRCLTAEKKDKPIILDMVDNITTTNIVHDIKEGYDWYEHQHLKDDEEHEPREPKDFVVYDYTLGIRQAIEKLVSVDFLRVPFEDRLQRLENFVTANNRLPFRSESDEYQNLAQLRRLNRDRQSQELNDILAKYARIYTDAVIKQRVMDFYHQHGRLPLKGRNREESTLRTMLYRRRDALYNDPDIAPLLAEGKNDVAGDEKLRLMTEFTEKHGRKPKPQEEEEYKMWTSMIANGKNDPRVQALYDKFGGTLAKRMKEYIAPLAEFIRREKRLPSTCESKEEHHLYSILVNLRKRYADHSDVAPLMAEIAALPTKGEKLIAKNDETTKKRILTFVDEHMRLPKYGSEDKDESDLAHQWVARRDRLCKNDAQMQAIRDQYDRGHLKYEVRYRKVRDWAAKHGRLPRLGDEIYYMWYGLVYSYRYTPEVQALAEKYGYKIQGKKRADVEEYLDGIEAFADEHNRLPSSASKDKDEKRQGGRWVRIKHFHTNHPRVIALKERFPIQNRR